MVDRTRELEFALGNAEKLVAENERDTIIVQRRCLRAAVDIPRGTRITRELIDVLRPAPRDAIFPYEIDRIVGLRVRRDIPAGEYFKWTMLEE
jgi:N-acetylneuraminate synthase